MFESLFGRDEAENRERDRSTHSDSLVFAPNTKIAYSSTLIPTLQRKNIELLDLYDQAEKAARARNIKQTKKLLGKFKYTFVNHVLHENTSLYLYLQRSAKDTTSKESIQFMKFEMDKIARKVMQFTRYGIKESTDIDAEFLQKMNSVSKILHSRIKEEENFVYPNYLAKGRHSSNDD